MADNSVTNRVPDIRDLLEDLPYEIQLKLYQTDPPEPLSAGEIAELEKIKSACSNTFSATQMGLEVFADYLHSAQAHPEEAKLNEASALMGLLAELAYQTHTIGAGADAFLLTHYKALAEKMKAMPESRKVTKIR